MSKPKQDPKNYRKHSERNKDLINKSLKELGAGRSVLIDSEDYLIAGNGVMEQAEALGIPTRVIETDGSELVVVKRTDLKLGDAKRKELALADNATSDASEWDVEALESDWDALELGVWGVFTPVTPDEVEKITIEKANEAISGYDDHNCELPIVPEFHEKYSYFIVFAKNEIDEAFIRSNFDLEQKHTSHKSTDDRLSNIIDFKKLQEICLRSK